MNRRAVRFLTATMVSIAVMLTVAPAGATNRAPATAPEVIRVASIPPLAGVHISIDGIPGVTGGDGTVVMPRQRLANGIANEIIVLDQLIQLGPDERAVYERTYYPTSANPVLIFDIEERVTFTFSDGDQARSPDEFDNLTVRSSVGEVRVVEPDEDGEWFQSQRVVPLNGALQLKDLYWTIQSLDRHGTNVVNRSQQRFVPADAHHVDVVVLYFTATFSARDALLFMSRGRRIDLTFPDGHVEQFQLDGDGKATVTGLPRGQYTVKVIGDGPGMKQPVTITRNQDVEVKVLSWIDIGIVAIIGIALVVGLFIVGRRMVRRRNAAHEARADEDVTEPGPEPELEAVAQAVVEPPAVEDEVEPEPESEPELEPEQELEPVAEIDEPEPEPEPELEPGVGPVSSNGAATANGSARRPQGRNAWQKHGSPRRQKSRRGQTRQTQGNRAGSKRGGARNGEVRRSARPAAGFESRPLIHRRLNPPR